MLRKISVLGLFALLVGCAVSPPPPQPIASPDFGDVTRKLQNNWGRCLNGSYPAARKQTQDKNAAAELAFQACAAEEQDLAAWVHLQIPYAPSPMPHLKAGMKQELIQEGHLSPLSEHTNAAIFSRLTGSGSALGCLVVVI